MNKHTWCVEKLSHQFKILNIRFLLWMLIALPLSIVVISNITKQKMLQTSHEMTGFSLNPLTLRSCSLRPPSPAIVLSSLLHFQILTPYSSLSSLCHLRTIPPTLVSPPGVFPLCISHPSQSSFPKPSPLSRLFPTFPALPPSIQPPFQVPLLPGDHQTNDTKVWCGQRPWPRGQR